MSIKKTWFSYILWLIATGFSILFTYNTVSFLGSYCGVYGSGKTEFMIGYTAIIIAGMILLSLLLYLLCSKIPVIIKNKWALRMLHLLAFIAITSLFVYTRLQSFISGELQSEQADYFFEMAKIGTGEANRLALEIAYPQAGLHVSVWEGIYIRFLSVLFLFLGNKIEILFWVQIVFQALSLLGLFLIGWNLKKGFAGWLPSVFYAISPVCASMIFNSGSSNFWILLSLFSIVILFLLQKLIISSWKVSRNRKMITYILSAVWGTAICVFVFAVKSGVMLDNGPAFLVPFQLKVPAQVLYTELFLWALLLLLYCITFWFSKSDSLSLYIIPAACAVSLFLFLQHYEKEVAFFLLLYSAFWLSLLGMEGIAQLFAKKQETLLKAKTLVSADALGKTDTLETAEAKRSSEQSDILVTENEEKDLEDTGVIRVSDILKNTAGDVSLNGEMMIEKNKENVISDSEKIPETDKTAMIENVLPMPKKHVSRCFEYGFEPSDEMMHYDVEVENDDYDYH